MKFAEAVEVASALDSPGQGSLKAGEKTVFGSGQEGSVVAKLSIGASQHLRKVRGAEATFLLGGIYGIEQRTPQRRQPRPSHPSRKLLLVQLSRYHSRATMVVALLARLDDWPTGPQ
jgi:hypothetical protein